MAVVKTAISLRESLFNEAEALARKLEVSRSQLFAMALENFIAQYQNKQLLTKINAAYSDVPTVAEATQQKYMKNYHRCNMEDRW
jgi:metal-responsive CopG/Arc/MetJ family transcriptional regulator